MAKTGVIIGRFQVPYLHAGHHHLISSVVDLSNDVVIMLGCSNKADVSNPLAANIRAEMIRQFYPDISFFAIGDKKSDVEWSEKVDFLLSFREDIMLYGSRDSFKKSYYGVHPYTEIPELPEHSGTAMREGMTFVNNVDFRKGIIYAHKQRAL